MKCGLLGRSLGHSYSPQIHSFFGDYSYELLEKEPQEVEHFLRSGDFTGLNVTIPYKKTVIPFLDEMTPLAQRLGCVNTVVRKNGKLLGHNTDYAGFLSLVNRSGLSPAGKKCLVLGSGGASNTAVAVLQDLGAHVVVISRIGENHYENLHLHADASILVNTTPVGMYPDTGLSPVSLEHFPHLEGVLDVIYNPARTGLLLEAERRGLVAENGLWMLVAQAKSAAEYFLDRAISEEMVDSVYHTLRRSMENIILIGMPGCGKSTIGQLLAEKSGKIFVDSDAEIEKWAKKSIPAIFAEDGEAVFRNWETQVLNHWCKRSGLVIATGGGCVTRAENAWLLRQNGRVFWLQRDLNQLSTNGRPLSQSQGVQALYAKRQGLYSQFADRTIENYGRPQEAADAIWEEFTCGF